MEYINDKRLIFFLKRRETFVNLYPDKIIDKGTSMEFLSLKKTAIEIVLCEF
jgi:hypothetical protein